MFKGIDVYGGNGAVDWDKAKAAGLQFAMLRCGFGQDRQDQDDKQFERNVTECERLGIPWGTYLYSYAGHMEDVAGEIAHVKRLLTGKSPTYPVVIDMEDADQFKLRHGYITSTPTVEQINRMTAIIEAFCTGITEAGYIAGWYANKDWTDNRLDASRLTKWPYWYARPDISAPDKDCAMWQDQIGSTGGTWPGVEGACDTDVSYVDYAGQTPAVQTVATVTSTEAATTSTDAAKQSGSTAVRSIQQRINALQIATLAVDGLNGPKTQAAVKSFQGICGLSTDAIWGPKTESAYQEIAAKPKLQDGSKGIPTRYVQARVGAKVDGIFGAKTDAAVKVWQKANDLVADGIVGPKTWAKLIG